MAFERTDVAVVVVHIGSVHVILHMLVKHFVRPCLSDCGTVLRNWTRKYPPTWNVGIIIRSVYGRSPWTKLVVARKLVQMMF